MAEDHELARPLRANPNDTAASLLRAAVGFLPVGGSIVTELIERVIPNQRQERLLLFVTEVARRLEAAEAGVAEIIERLNPEQIGAFEDGAAAAVKSVSDERVADLARLVARVIEGKANEASDLRSFIRLLSEITEAEVLHLMWWTEKYGHNLEWKRAQLGRDPYQLEKEGPYDEFKHRASMGEMYRFSRLVSMGLIDRKLRIRPSPYGGESELEEVSELTDEGRDFLRMLNILGPKER